MVNIWPFIDQILGTACPLCHAPGSGLCANCIDALPRNHHSCTRCAEPLPASVEPGCLCGNCQKQPPAFDRVIAPLRYQAPVDDLVARFKYHHRLDLGRALGAVLVDTVAGRGDDIDLLLPVPVHRTRLRERGFNQAAELARYLAQRLGIAYSARHLARTSNRAQRTLKRRTRRSNVDHAFTCLGGLPRRVALIDDVVTTGATANAVSRELKRAGAAHVEVWAVARTPRET